MSAEPDLFAFGYPNAPGYKARETSREAGEKIANRAPVIRERIVDLLTPALQLTADEAADLLRLPILAVRPRFSELATQGKVIDSGQRRPNSSGKRAIVWRLAA